MKKVSKPGTSPCQTPRLIKALFPAKPFGKTALGILAGFVLLAAATAHANEAHDLIATLRSDASVPAKCTACLRLRIVGTADGVPVLASLLVDTTPQPLQQAACNALEGIPLPEAIAALRQALASASGSLEAELIHSLGWRRDPDSIPLLKPLLFHTNSATACAAATALGRIGTTACVEALLHARGTSTETVLPSIVDGLLLCADAMRRAGDFLGAAMIYRDVLSRTPTPAAKAAAWRGLVTTDAGQGLSLVLDALTGSDPVLRATAAKTLWELNVPTLREACLARWSDLPPAAQIAIVQTSSGKPGSPGTPSATRQMQVLRAAAESPNLAVRIAAWQSLGEVGSMDDVVALARAAAAARDPTERDAAHEALCCLSSPGIQQVLIKSLDSLDTPEKTEILRALGDRGDTSATNALLQNAANGPLRVRLAALDSLRKIAVPNTLLPLLDLAAKSGPEADVQPMLGALYAVCRATPDKQQATRLVLEAMNSLDSGQRRRVMPILAELGTPLALETARSALSATDTDTVRDALQVLAQWPNAAAAPILLSLARNYTNAAVRILALRGCMEVATLEPDYGKRLAWLQEARLAAQRPDERILALGKLSQIPTPAALQIVTSDLNVPELATEAGLATLSIVEQIAAANPGLAAESAALILGKCKNPELVKRAWALRGKPVSAIPFIRDWQVAGPYRQPGATGALAVFDILFAPEKPGEQVAWKPVPSTEHVNLSILFPNEVNCAAYLRTQVIALDECDAVLLVGSDDGIKAWLNGLVVLSNNVDRGDVADQDMAPIHLRKGTNDLLVKITQGGGGWSARARIASADGQPIPGLRFATITRQ